MDPEESERQGMRAKPRKSLGQHFLVDEALADWIVEQANINEGDRVLEIGPGRGILTGRLKALTNNLILIERDERFVTHIKNELDLNVIHGDALKVEVPDFDKVVSNLPYQISSGITVRLLEMGFESGILMYQKEFAEHLVAKPGKRAYSRISVMVGYRAECEIIRRVPKGSFRPVPKVDSAVVSIRPRAPNFTMDSEPYFQKVVSILFAHKNRKVRNGIVSEHRRIGLEKKEAKELAGKLPYSDIRPRTLSPGQLAEIADALLKHGK